MQILNLNRMNDALFKNIFTKNTDITLALINSVFEFQGSALISDIEIIDRNLDAEEEDGQMTFFSKFDADDSVTLSGSRKDDDTDFADIAGSIADSVKEEIENGEKEPEVSAAPTKRFAEDFTAQALDAALRDDDEAIERALYGLLSEK